MVSICEPAPVPPTMNSRSNMCSHRVMPDFAQDTQMPNAEVMLPIQCIWRGSKFAPRVPYSGANGTLECTSPMVVPSLGATVLR